MRAPIALRISFAPPGMEGRCGLVVFLASLRVRYHTEPCKYVLPVLVDFIALGCAGRKDGIMELSLLVQGEAHGSSTCGRCRNLLV